MRKEREISKKEAEKLSVFERELSFIPSDLYRYLTRRALCKVSDKFFIASASSTGKYHPKYASGTGGLVRHTKACIVFAMELLALKQYSEINEERSAVISALILHDTCKSGVAWESKYTKHEHPLLVRKLLADGELYQQEQIAWNKICNLIESHMGQWTENNKSDVILPDALGYPVNEFVHLCDYLASRKDIGVYSLDSSSKSTVKVQHVDKSTKWQNQLCTQVQSDTLETWLAKGGTQLDVNLRNKVNRALNNRGLTKGEASKLIGELKTAIDGEVTPAQLSALRDVLQKPWLTKDLTEVDIKDAEWALKNPGGMTKLRAREILSKVYD